MAKVLDFNKEKSRRAALDEELYVDIDDLNEDELIELIEGFLEQAELDLEDTFFLAANDEEYYDQVMEFDPDFSFYDWEDEGE